MSWTSSISVLGSPRFAFSGALLFRAAALAKTNQMSRSLSTPVRSKRFNVLANFSDCRNAHFQAWQRIFGIRFVEQHLYWTDLDDVAFFDLGGTLTPTAVDVSPARRFQVFDQALPVPDRNRSMSTTDTIAVQPDLACGKPSKGHRRPCGVTCRKKPPRKQFVNGFQDEPLESSNPVELLDRLVLSTFPFDERRILPGPLDRQLLPLPDAVPSIRWSCWRSLLRSVREFWDRTRTARYEIPQTRIVRQKKRGRSQGPHQTGPCVDRLAHSSMAP